MQKASELTQQERSKGLVDAEGYFHPPGPTSIIGALSPHIPEPWGSQQETPRLGIIGWFRSRAWYMKANEAAGLEIVKLRFERENYRVASEANKESVRLLKLDVEEYKNLLRESQEDFNRAKDLLESAKAEILDLLAEAAGQREQEAILVACLAEEKRRAASYKGKYNRIKNGGKHGKA